MHRFLSSVVLVALCFAHVVGAWHGVAHAGHLGNSAVTETSVAGHEHSIPLAEHHCGAFDAACATGTPVATEMLIAKVIATQVAAAAFLVDGVPLFFQGFSDARAPPIFS